METYRVTGEAPVWQKRLYDYVRIDAFCIGQGIPPELEFKGDGTESDPQAIVLADGTNPLAGCRITYPEEGIAKIGRVCVVRSHQKSGIGRKLLEEAEKWISENGVSHIVISSQDRAAGFYQKAGYVLNESEDPDRYETHKTSDRDDVPQNVGNSETQNGKKPGAAEKTAESKAQEEQRKSLGFKCVLVEKYL